MSLGGRARNLNLYVKKLMTGTFIVQLKYYTALKFVTASTTSLEPAHLDL